MRDEREGRRWRKMKGLWKRGEERRREEGESKTS